MQTRINTIYERASEKNDLDYDLVKNIGDSIFMEWQKAMKDPPSVVIKVRGFGYFFLRKRVMQQEMEKIEGRFDGSKTPYPIESLESRWNFLNKLKLRWEEYKTYLESKDKIRKERAIQKSKIIKTKEEDDD